MFFNTNVFLTRYATGQYNADGIFVPGETETTTIKANVQPLNQREMEQYTHVLQGGNRSAMLVKIYTNEVLLTDVQTTGQRADVITWNNRNFKIVMVEEWLSGIISHYRYIGQELIGNDNN
jgi:hypothetical protein